MTGLGYLNKWRDCLGLSQSREADLIKFIQKVTTSGRVIIDGRLLSIEGGKLLISPPIVNASSIEESSVVDDKDDSPMPHGRERKIQK